MVSMSADSREMRGRQICEKGTEIERIDEGTYRLASQSGSGFYQVLFSSPQGWKCSCPDCVNRAVKCKHVWAVEFSASLQDPRLMSLEPVLSFPLSTCPVAVDGVSPDWESRIGIRQAQPTVAGVLQASLQAKP